MSTAGPAHRVQSAQVEYGYPQGHLGHLNHVEEINFTKFKAACEVKGLYTPGKDNEEGSHDDATLLRFLRARRFVVADALQQFQDTENWRKANEIGKLYETIDLDHYEETRRLYPQWTGRRDRRGIPVYVFEVKHLNAKTMAAYEKSAKETGTSSKAKTDGKTSPKLLRLFALYENLTRFTMPLCSALTDRDHPRTPITQSNNIVDISGVGLKQFWNLRTHMQDASTLATAHYPETLDRIFVIGAPAFFPTVWGWIKKWFDPITTSKIFIISHADVKKTLESFIDPVNIPKKYGGQLEFQFGDQPVLDPQLKDVVEWTTGSDFPHGPMYWVHEKGKNEDGQTLSKMKAFAVGSRDGEDRRIEVCTLATTILDDEDTDGTRTPIQLNEKQKYPDSRPDLISMPTEAETPPQTITEKAEDAEATKTGQPVPENSMVPQVEQPTIAEPKTATGADTEPKVVVQNGEVVPVSRPELKSFVTATEDLTLSTKENGDIQEPHKTQTATLLDPNITLADHAINGQALLAGSEMDKGKGTA